MAETKSNAYATLSRIAIGCVLGAVIAVIIALAVNSNPPNLYIADLEDMLRHQAAVTGWLSAAGGLLGIGITAGLVRLGVTAVLAELPGRTVAQPAAPTTYSDPGAPSA